MRRKNHPGDRVCQSRKPEPSGHGPAPTRERLLTEAEVAEWLGLSPLTLRKWRCLRTHPLPFLKIAKVIRYKESDVLPFLESHMIVPRPPEAF